MKDMETKRASELRVGDKVAERDGCTLLVVKCVGYGKSIRLTLSNHNQYMSGAPECEKTVRASSWVRVSIW